MPRTMIRWFVAGPLTVWLFASTIHAQPVSVTGANPPTGEQDTVGLIVRVTGRNFTPGARADFFKSKTSDPAGVTVRETRFVSATELDAVVDIAPTAELSYFDVRVTTLAGRSGKGSDLFQVVQKVVGANACVVQPLPTNVTLVQRLNGVNPSGAPIYRGQLGLGMSARHVTIKGQSVLLLAAPADPGMEVFFLTEGLGGLAAVDAINPHRRLTAAGTNALRPAAIGDLNGDGAPDIVAGSRDQQKAVVFLGAWDGLGELTFGAARAACRVRIRAGHR